MDLVVFQIVSFLQTCQTEWVSFLSVVFCFAAILFSFRTFGLLGLYAYNIVALILANIQVLRLVNYSFAPEPAAMGTVVFCTTFLASDLIVEHYGAKAARQGLWLCFACQIFVSVSMILAVGHALPLDVQEQHNHQAQEAMLALFTPSPRLFAASLCAYAISQLFDIWVFERIRHLCQNRWIWLRQNVSTALSGILDNGVFSLLAWIILAPRPLPLESVLITFIAWTQIIRIVVAFLGTPIMYLSYGLKPKNL
jgi:queuosine precursor transporter